MDATDIPAGVFNCVFGRGAELGPFLTTHAQVDCVSFTGSTQVGKQIQRDAADSIKRVCLELGGKSPFIIGQTSSLQQAVKFGVEDVMMNSGQTCVALTRMLVHQSHYSQAVAIAVEHAKSLSLGDPNQDGTFLGPVVSQQQQQRVLDCIAIGKEEGASLVLGSEQVEKAPGYYISPTIFADVTNNMRIAREEIFGPVLCILAYQNEQDAIDIANDSPYGLSARVWTDDAQECERICRQLRAGQVFKNAAIWHNTAAFGGYKQSGNGRELGMQGIEEFLETKSVINASE